MPKIKPIRPERHLMRLPDVMKTTGLCRSSIYQGMADGTFPASTKIGLRAVGWDSDRVFDWRDARLADADDDKLPSEKKSVLPTRKTRSVRVAALDTA